MVKQPEFGQRLRALRLERGLSLRELSGEGMSISYLSRLESGARPPTAKAIKYLAQHLNVSFTRLEAQPAPTLSKLLASLTSDDERRVTADELAAAVRADDSDAGTRWQALWLLATIQAEQGRRTEELNTLQQLVDLSSALDDATLGVRARTQLARCFRSLGDIASTQRIASQALEIGEAHHLPVLETARATMLLVSAEAELGRLHDARTRAEGLLATVGDAPATLQVEAMWTAASACIRQGDHAAAGEFLESALHRLSSHDDLTLWLRLRLAAVALYLQISPPRTDLARQRLTEVEPALRLIGTPLHEEEFQLLNATYAFHTGDHETAWRLCSALLDSQSHLTYRDHVRLQMLGYRLQMVRGDRAAAAAGLQRLAEEAQKATNLDLTAEIWRTLAEALAAS